MTFSSNRHQSRSHKGFKHSREKSQIAVEIKSFIGRSTITEFHMAVGQFLNYRLALQKVKSERVLYLAVPFDINSGCIGINITHSQDTAVPCPYN
jgi:XisH protein